MPKNFGERPRGTKSTEKRDGLPEKNRTINEKAKHDIEADERFKDIRKDPRFRPFRTDERKIKVDDRFKGMLTDPKFNLTHKVDPRGRVAKVKCSAENLRKFYALEAEEPKKRIDNEEAEADDDSASETASDASEDDDVDTALPDYARGKATLESSSSEVCAHVVHVQQFNNHLYVESSVSMLIIELYSIFKISLFSCENNSK